MKKIIWLCLISLSLFQANVLAQNYDEPPSAGTGGSDNTSIGHNAGSAGTQNTSVGKSAGDLVTGTFNVFYGFEAGKTTASSSASYNSFLGSRSGYTVSSGTNNSFVGYQSGYSSTTASNNTFLGYRAGYSNTTGAGNVFIGANAGYAETGSNKLYIDNSNVPVPLIMGDFSSNRVGINAPAETYTLNVGGTINATNLYINNTLYRASKWDDAGNYIVNTGRVQIGQYGGGVPSGFTLAVGGKVICEEIRVKLKTTWPDYVFDDNYQLLSLSELKKYIHKNKHLPGVPSAAEVAEKGGVDVGEMNAILLKKIEELTLQIILLNEKLENKSSH